MSELGAQSRMNSSMFSANYPVGIAHEKSICCLAVNCVNCLPLSGAELGRVTKLLELPQASD